MKNIHLLIFLFISFSALAQKNFDSSAYVNFNQSRWESFDFANFTKEKPLKELSIEEKLAGLSKAWAEARYNFANFDLVPKLNWDSVYQAYIPKVMTTTTVEDYYKTLQNFYQHLHDGHTAITMPFHFFKSLSGIIPLDLKWIENKAVVISNSSSNRNEQKIKPGTELLSWNGKPLDTYIRENLSHYLHFSTVQDSIERIYRYELLPGKAGDSVLLGFKTPEGKIISQVFYYKAVEKFWDRLPLFEFRILNSNIAYLQVNSFGDDKLVHVIDSLFPIIIKNKSLIIDLRNNGGGNGNNGFEILGYLTSQPFMQGKSVIRKYRPVGRAWGGVEVTSIETDNWKPYKNLLFAGPVVVLTSAATYSAAEDFTSVFKSLQRGKVIGETTGGSTGQPILFSLPGGGMGRVCAKRDFFQDGTEFIGIGIQPDIVVKPSVKAVTGGRDEVLEEAIRFLVKRP